jgi:hypothetical protein
MNGRIRVDYSDYRRQMETARDCLERWLTGPAASPALAHALERVNAGLQAIADHDGNPPTSR